MNNRSPFRGPEDTEELSEYAADGAVERPPPAAMGPDIGVFEEVQYHAESAVSGLIDRFVNDDDIMQGTPRGNAQIRIYINDETMRIVDRVVTPHRDIFAMASGAIFASVLMKLRETNALFVNQDGDVLTPDARTNLDKRILEIIPRGAVPFVSLLMSPHENTNPAAVAAGPLGSQFCTTTAALRVLCRLVHVLDTRSTCI